MNLELLEIQPQELRFIFESKKQSYCSIRLTNKSDYHVAFKVKTTSSQKYCVKPNTGVIKPSLACDITVTMQAQNVRPTDFICKDKFLIQSRVVPVGTKEEHITYSMFQEDGKQRIEEKKLKVVLVSPPQSPVLSPMNEIMRIRPYNAANESKDDLLQRISTCVKVDEEIEMGRRSCEIIERRKNAESIMRKHTTEELRLSNDVEEMKSKLRELESILRQEKVTSNEKTETRVEIGIGFQLLVVFVVAVASLYLGYMLQS